MKRYMVILAAGDVLIMTRNISVLPFLLILIFSPYPSNSSTSSPSPPLKRGVTRFLGRNALPKAMHHLTFFEFSL
jgi:hypothetical protein